MTCRKYDNDFRQGAVDLLFSSGRPLNYGESLRTYHVMARVNRRQAIFLGGDDRGESD
jgi:hypothetical protein